MVILRMNFDVYILGSVYFESGKIFFYLVNENYLIYYIFV